MFKVGEIVKFVEGLGKSSRGNIINFFTKDIPNEYIKHGDTAINREYYNKYYAKVTYVDPKLKICCVEFKTDEGLFVAQGFDFNAIERTRIDNWRDIIC